NRRLFDEQCRLREMSDLLRGATCGRHAIDVLMVGLVIEPAPVGRIEHVADTVVTLGELLGRATVRGNLPKVDRAAGIRGIDKPASIRRSGSGEFVVRREGELLRVPSGDIEINELIESPSHQGIGDSSSVAGYRN